MITEADVKPYAEYQLVSFADGRPDAGTSVVCLCGSVHQTMPTAYGHRAQCERFRIRWTVIYPGSLWTAEPYQTLETLPLGKQITEGSRS